jgi:hypothetical protein
VGIVSPVHDHASAADPPSFTCPRCGARSFHPEDVRFGYCGRCHDWTVRDEAPCLWCEIATASLRAASGDSTATGVCTKHLSEPVTPAKVPDAPRIITSDHVPEGEAWVLADFGALDFDRILAVTPPSFITPGRFAAAGTERSAESPIQQLIEARKILRAQPPSVLQLAFHDRTDIDLVLEAWKIEMGPTEAHRGALEKQLFGIALVVDPDVAMGSMRAKWSDGHEETIPVLRRPRWTRAWRRITRFLLGG